MEELLVMVGVVIKVPRSGSSSERGDRAGGMIKWLVQSSCVSPP